MSKTNTELSYWSRKTRLALEKIETPSPIPARKCATSKFQSIRGEKKLERPFKTISWKLVRGETIKKAKNLITEARFRNLYFGKA